MRHNSGMSTSSQLEVVFANGPEEQADVFRFRYRVLVAGMNRTFPNADRTSKQLTDIADRAALHVCVKKQGKIAAALRMIVAPLAQLPVYMKERYSLAPFGDLMDLTVSFTDYLVVDTKLLDAHAANLLMTAAYKIACAQGSGFDFTNAAAGEVAVFERLGYRRYADNYHDPDFGSRIPMVLPTGDTAHLARVTSPFQKISSAQQQDVELVNWFRRQFPDASAAAQPAAMDEEALWAFLTRRLDQVPHHGVPLLLGLDHKDAMRFLKLATVIQFNQGDHIVKKGDIGNEMFVILKGSVDVRDDGHRLAAFGKGGIFGEMAYLNAEPRSADVLARESTEILVVTQDTMKASMEKMPEVAARILFNMSLILTERLKDTSAKFVKAKAVAV
jgi:gas vesicle protein